MLSNSHEKINLIIDKMLKFMPVKMDEFNLSIQEKDFIELFEQYLMIVIEKPN